MKIQPKHYLIITTLFAVAASLFFLGRGLSIMWNKERKLQTLNDLLGFRRQLTTSTASMASCQSL